VIQLGDLHYDFLESSRSSLDVHDQSPPVGLVTALARPVIPVLADAIGSAIERHGRCAVVVCGDLTSKGNLEVFERSLEFLSGVFDLTERTHLSEHDVHLVPGNHDVDFRGTMPFVDLGTDRFGILDDLVNASSLPVSLTIGVRTSVVSAGDASLSVVSLNTARGQGSPRSFEGLSDEAHSRLVDAAAAVDVDLEDLLTTIGVSQASSFEILDIPIVHPDDLDALTRALSAQVHGLIAVVGHHGFLPQGLPRLNPYTEMVNGGAVRETLLASRRPVLYLHVHRDTVEIVKGGPDVTNETMGGPVVVVSAPPLSEGFNELEIEFSGAGEAMGVYLRRHRVNRATGAIQQPPVTKIPLISEGVLGEAIREVLTYLSEHRVCTGQDIVDHLKLNGLSDEEIEKARSVTERAVWQGVLREVGSTAGVPFEERGFVFGA